MENSRRRVELLNVLLFTLPGTPVIYYGDEIGMGDNIYLGDRNGVRTPMQWNGDRNAGFSRADPARLFAPPIMDPVYGYQSINVEAQERYPFSLLNWMKRLIALRKAHAVLGRGALEFVNCANRKVLAYIRRDEHETVLVVLSLSRQAQPVSLELAAFEGLVPVEMFGQTEFPRIGDGPYPLSLGPYGYLLFRLEHSVTPIAARASMPEPVVESVERAPGPARRRGVGHAARRGVAAVHRARRAGGLPRIAAVVGHRARAAEGGTVRRLGRAARRRAPRVPHDCRGRPGRWRA